VSEIEDTVTGGPSGDYDTRTEGPSKPGIPEDQRQMANPTDPRSPGYDKHRDGPVSPRC
jgi:hypothetical protein